MSINKKTGNFKNRPIDYYRFATTNYCTDISTFIFILYLSIMLSYNQKNIQPTTTNHPNCSNCGLQNL